MKAVDACLESCRAEGSPTEQQSSLTFDLDNNVRSSLLDILDDSTSVTEEDCQPLIDLMSTSMEPKKIKRYVRLAALLEPLIAFHSLESRISRILLKSSHADTPNLKAYHICQEPDDHARIFPQVFGSSTRRQTTL